MGYVVAGLCFLFIAAVAFIATGGRIVARRHRSDGNQAIIVRGLRQIGASVQVLSQVGDGCPDLLVGWQGVNYLMEVKDSAQPLSARSLTEDQVKWHRNWRGMVYIVQTMSDAFLVLGIKI